MLLSLEKFAPKTTSTSLKTPLVVLHGLFGSKQNWKSLSKSFASQLGVPVYAIDLRNHGDSPWSHSKFTYEDMATDIYDTVTKKVGMPKVNVIGHSMGGKVAMSLALNSTFSNIVNKLIVVDILPRKGQLNEPIPTALRVLQEMSTMKFATRQDAQKYLSKYIEEPEIVGFLMQNFVPSNEMKEVKTGYKSKYALRLDIDSIVKSSEELAGFQVSNMKPFPNPTLFIYGTRSNYVTSNVKPELQALFPQTSMMSMDTGHWVHSEDPKTFVKIACSFLV